MYITERSSCYPTKQMTPNGITEVFARELKTEKKNRLNDLLEYDTIPNHTVLQNGSQKQFNRYQSMYIFLLLNKHYFNRRNEKIT